MLKSLRSIFILAVAIHSSPPVHAGSSEWHHVEAGSVRIVTTGMPDAEGLVHGALEIRLKPGWKTYWRDPGSSGVPPKLDVLADGRATAVEMGFPAPQRFDDGYAQWAGYDGSVSLALTLRLPSGMNAPSLIRADAFLGVCETICIPVQTELTFNLHDEADESEHRAVVMSAFAALPGPARRDFGARTRELGDDTLLVEATLPAGAEVVDLFLAGTDTFALGIPERVADAGNRLLFRVPLMGGLRQDAPEEIAYTLVTSAGAVAGTLSLR